MIYDIGGERLTRSITVSKAERKKYAIAVELGIDSISLNRDSVLKTLLDIASVEGIS
jgi:phosphoenolpyruvate synthase/pyruvate phosphate dikinase